MCSRTSSRSLTCPRLVYTGWSRCKQVHNLLCLGHHWFYRAGPLEGDIQNTNTGPGLVCQTSTMENRWWPWTCRMYIFINGSCWIISTTCGLWWDRVFSVHCALLWPHQCPLGFNESGGGSTPSEVRGASHPLLSPHTADSSDQCISSEFEWPFGRSGDQRTLVESWLHINFLKVRAICLLLKGFLQSKGKQLEVLMDNTIEMWSCKKQGGTCTLCQDALRLWKGLDL